MHKHNNIGKCGEITTEVGDQVLGKRRAVGAARVTTFLTVALFYGRVIIIHVHNEKH